MHVLLKVALRKFRFVGRSRIELSLSYKLSSYRSLLRQQPGLEEQLIRKRVRSVIPQIVNISPVNRSTTSVATESEVMHGDQLPAIIHLLLSIYCLFLLGATGYISVKRTLWWDEIITYYVATLPSMHDVWRVSLLGGDSQPPLYYLIVRSSVALFGASEFALRLPSVIAYSAAVVLIYLAARRRTSPIYGLIAALLFSLTDALVYSIEARPYALVLAFSSLAFYAWQRTRDLQARWVALMVLSLALSASIGVSYNAILGFAPFFLGELAWRIHSKRFDWASLFAICIAVWPLLFLRPHMVALRAYGTDYWGSTTFAALQELYLVLFGKPIVLAIIVLALACVLVPFFRIQDRWDPSTFLTARHEFVAATGFFLLPIIELISAIFTKAIHPRYIIETCAGAAIALAFLLFSMRLRFRTELTIAVILGLEVAHALSGRMRWPQDAGWGNVQPLAEFLKPSPLVPTFQPIVVGVEAYHVVLRYGSDSLRSRSLYVITPSHKKGHVAVIESALHNVIPAFQNVISLDKLQRSYSTFLLFDEDPWFLKDLLDIHAKISLQATIANRNLYKVELQGASR